MPLQTSGTISLNDIHVEAGGSSGTQASINDSDIRALISKSSGAQMAFSEWYGASSVAYSGTMTVGSNIVSGQYGSSSYGFNDASRSAIFTVDFGTLSNIDASGFSNSGALISHLAHLSTINAVRLMIDDNTTISNSGWSTLTIGGTQYARTAASFSATNNSAGNAQGKKGTWTWTGSNPFGTSGGAYKSITIS